MHSIPEQIRAIDRAKIERAREMTFEERFLAGADLFELACSVARDGIRMQFPSASDEEVERVLIERLSRARRMERSQ
jgi:hypothetical protein